MPMPLEGIRVIELNRVAPGSLCTMILGDMGAEVIRIETPGQETMDASEDDKWRLSEFVNRNKKSLTLNLKDSDAQTVLHRLTKETDVFVEGFRPGVTNRLGADYETLSAINDQIVYCSLSGFGQNGPYKNRAGHDLNYLSLAGVLSLFGHKHEAPQIPLNIIADYGGATMHGVSGILLALYARVNTGRGQHVDVSYLDTAFALLSAVPGVGNHFLGDKIPEPGKQVFAGDHPYYTVYETKDKKWFSVGCMEPWLWSNFCEAVRMPELKQYQMHPHDFHREATQGQKDAKEKLTTLFKGRTSKEWQLFFEDKDVCVGEVNNVNDALQNPQLLERNMIIDDEHSDIENAKQPGIAIKLSETPGIVRSRPPRLGEHNLEILDALGFTSNQIEVLTRKKAI